MSDKLGEEFTTVEYVKAHGLQVNMKDSGATRIVAAHLRKKGYVEKRKRYKGRIAKVWSKKHDRESLIKQLENLE